MIIDVIKWKIWRRIYKFYEIDTLRRSRNKFATGYLQQKNGLNKRILSKEWDEIKAFWTPYFNVSNKKAWFEYYHALDDNNNRLKYYIPDDIYFMYIDLFFSHARKAMCVDDKNLYDLLFFEGTIYLLTQVVPLE